MSRIRQGWRAWVSMTVAVVMLLSVVAFAAESETETESESEKVYRDAKVMFLIDTVRVRAEANADSETVAFADRGDALTVLGELSGWYHVRLDHPEIEEQSTQETETVSAEEKETSVSESAKEGYVKGTYLTENKDEADQAVAANDAEIRRKEAEAAAAAAAAQAASSSGGNSGGGSPKKKSSGKTVVSTQNVDDCDGSGHGTKITTYSDGSTSTSRY